MLSRRCQTKLSGWETSGVRHVILSLEICIFLAVVLAGCGKSSTEEKKIRDISYEVVAEQDIKGTMKALIEERKTLPFHMTFRDGDDFYVGIGYGEKETGGYSVSVDAVYQTNLGIRVETSIAGPEKSNHEKQIPSYPYIVIRMKNQKDTVIFDE